MFYTFIKGISNMLHYDLKVFQNLGTFAFKCFIFYGIKSFAV